MRARKRIGKLWLRAREFVLALVLVPLIMVLWSVEWLLARLLWWRR